MSNPGEFDPAEAIRQQEATEEAERRNFQAQGAVNRANMLKLYSYAEERLEAIRDPVVSEFVVTEQWWTPEPNWISRRKMRADQHVIEHRSVGLFTNRDEYKVATRHERQTRYYGSWLWLVNTRGGSTNNTRSGLVKLQRSHAGYVYVGVGGWDPREVGHVIVGLTDLRGRELPGRSWNHPGFQVLASLEEVVGDEAFITVSSNLSQHFPTGTEIERLTRAVRQALDFVSTGQPPEPKQIHNDYD